MLDNELFELINRKGFKNVWSMLQYLIDIGCNEEDMLIIIPKFFTESEYFKDVAYGRVIGIVKERFTGKAIETVEWVMFIGMIDESNSKLRGMFDAYKRGIFECKVDNTVEKDMESLCAEKYEFINLPDITIDYFRNSAIKHYGYQLL